MKIFVDTSAFIAFILDREFLHEQVSKQYSLYKQEKAYFFTSDYVLDELFTQCLYKAGRYHAKEAIALIDEITTHNELTVLEIDSHTFKKAQEIFLKFSEHKISFTDATTYVLYKDFALDEIFTLDSDFKKMRAKTSSFVL